MAKKPPSWTVTVAALPDSTFPFATKNHIFQTRDELVRAIDFVVEHHGDLPIVQQIDKQVTDPASTIWLIVGNRWRDETKRLNTLLRSSDVRATRAKARREEDRQFRETASRERRFETRERICADGEAILGELAAIWRTCEEPDQEDEIDWNRVSYLCGRLTSLGTRVRAQTTAAMKRERDQ